MSTSRKRKTSDKEVGDTRQVVVMKKRRYTSASPPTPPPPSSSSSSSSAFPDYYESPPASQAVPWEMYDDDDDDDDDDFKFSPASRPLTQTTEREERSSPQTVYILPNSSIVCRRTMQHIYPTIKQTQNPPQATVRTCLHRCATF